VKKIYQIMVDVEIVNMSSAASEAFFESLKAEIEQHCQNFQMTEISEMRVTDIIEIEGD